MGEVGCLKDGHFQNLQVGGGANLSFGALETEFPNIAWEGITGAGALASNSFNTVDVGASAALTLPTIALSKKGDFVHMILSDSLGNGYMIKIGTTGDILAEGSYARFMPGLAGRDGSVAIANPGATADHAFLNINGASDSEAGKGSTIDCYFNGVNWSIRATIYPKGDHSGAVDGSSTFASS